MNRKFFLLSLLLVIVAVCLSGCATLLKTVVSPGERLVIDYRFEEAIPVLQEEMRNNNPSILKYIYLGTCYYIAGQPEKTLQVTQDGLKKHAGNKVLMRAGYENMGMAYFELKRYNEAIQYLKKSLQVKESATAHSNIGAVYLELGKFDLVLPEMEAALSMDKDLVNKSFKTISAMQRAGNLEFALSSWKKFVATTKFAPHYIRDEKLLGKVINPEQIQHAEQQIEILEKKRHPKTFSSPKLAEQLDAYAEKVTGYLLSSPLALGRRELSIAIGDFVKEKVDDKPKLGNMLATSLTEKFNKSGRVIVTQDDDTTGSFYLYGVIQDVGPIVIIRPHIQDSEGKHPIPSPEPLELAKNSEVAQHL